MQQMAAACWDLLVGVGQRPSTARNGDLETLCGYVAEASGRRSGDLKRQLLKLRTTLLSRDDAILNDFPSD